MTKHSFPSLRTPQSEPDAPYIRRAAVDALERGTVVYEHQDATEYLLSGGGVLIVPHDPEQ